MATRKSPAKTKAVKTPLRSRATPARSTVVIDLPLGRIRPDPDQPRRDFDGVPLKEVTEEFQNLAESIRTVGILEPLLVREAGKDYVLIAGERRWRAARLAGLDTVPCIVKVFETRERMLAQLSENLQRRDMSDIDVIRAINSLLATYPELMKKDLARLFNRAPSFISRYIKAAEPQHLRLIEEGIVESAAVLEKLLAMDNASREALIRKARKGKRKISAFEIEQARKMISPEPTALRKVLTSNARMDHLKHIPTRIAHRLAAELGEEVTPLRSRDRLRDAGGGFTNLPAESGDPHGPLPTTLTDTHVIQLTAVQLRKLIRALGGQPPREDVFLKTALLELLT